MKKAHLLLASVAGLTACLLILLWVTTYQYPRPLFVTNDGQLTPEESVQEETETKVAPVDTPLQNSTTTEPETLPPLSTNPPAKSEIPVTKTETVKTNSVKTVAPLTPTETPFTLFTPNWDAINTVARASAVNIICISPSGGLLNPISGSGVFVSEKGVILTNAHIGQYFLLEKYNNQDLIDCTIRTGSPAYPAYKANLLFISPTWIKNHANDIVKQNNVGTGEYDYALLLVTGTAGPNVIMPTTFPHLKPEISPNTEMVGEPVLINAYPAGFLGGIAIQTNLYLTSSVSSVKEIFTFASTSIDLITLTGNINAQRGASGGAVSNSRGLLSGLIVTSSEADYTAERNLGAITLSYINRILTEESGVSLDILLEKNPQQASDEFTQNLKPQLSKLLINAIMENQ